jgi:ER membrane protein complex subunit 3
MTKLHNSGAIPSGLSEQTLLLDSDIRDWVVLPLLVIMVCAGLLRHFSGILLRPNPKPMSSRIESRGKQALACAMRIRTGNANFISHSKWEARRKYYSDREVGYLRQEAEWATKEAENQTDTGAIDPMNPMAMMDGMKGNMGKWKTFLFGSSLS